MWWLLQLYKQGMVKADPVWWQWKAREAKELHWHSWSRAIEFSDLLNVRNKEEKMVDNAWHSFGFLKVIPYNGFLIMTTSPCTIWPPVTFLTSPPVTISFPTPSSCMDSLLLEYSNQAPIWGHLYLLFPFPRVLFSQVALWLGLSYLSSLIFWLRPSLITYVCVHAPTHTHTRPHTHTPTNLALPIQLLMLFFSQLLTPLDICFTHSFLYLFSQSNVSLLRQDFCLFFSLLQPWCLCKRTFQSKFSSTS